MLSEMGVKNLLMNAIASEQNSENPGSPYEMKIESHFISFPSQTESKEISKTDRIIPMIHNLQRFQCAGKLS